MFITSLATSWCRNNTNCKKYGDNEWTMHRHNMRQTCPCTTATCRYRFARYPSCGILTPTRTIPVKQQLEPQVTAPVKHLKNDKLRVAGHGLNNPRVRRTNTAKRAPNLPMHHGHVPVHVCTISILWNSHTIPYHSSETTT